MVQLEPYGVSEGTSLYQLNDLTDAWMAPSVETVSYWRYVKVRVVAYQMNLWIPLEKLEKYNLLLLVGVMVWTDTVADHEVDAALAAAEGYSDCLD